MERKTAGVTGSLLESAGGGWTCDMLAGRAVRVDAEDAEEDITQRSRDTHAPYFKTTTTNDHYQKLPLRKTSHYPPTDEPGWMAPIPTNLRHSVKK